MSLHASESLYATGFQRLKANPSLRVGLAGISAVIVGALLYHTISSLRTRKYYDVIIVDDGNTSVVRYILATLNSLSAFSFGVTIFAGNPFDRDTIPDYSSLVPSAFNQPITHISVIHRSTVIGLSAVYTPPATCDLTVPHVKARMEEPCFFLKKSHLRFDVDAISRSCRFTTLSSHIHKTVRRTCFTAARFTQQYGSDEAVLHTRTDALLAAASTRKDLESNTPPFPRYGANGVLIYEPEYDGSKDLTLRVVTGSVAAIGGMIDAVEGMMLIAWNIFEKFRGKNPETT